VGTRARVESVLSLSILLLLALGALGARPAGAELPSPRTKWRSLETANFRVVGDVSARKIADIAERLETFRAVLGRLKPQATSRSPVPTLVLAFSGERSFRPYLILDQQQTKGYAGVYHPTQWGNYMAFDAVSGEDPLSSVYSGYVYFFISSHYPSTPLWLQNGLGQFYETFRATSSGMEIGRPSETHLRFLQQGWRIPLPQLLAIDRQSPEYRDPDQFGSYSAHCWALVHYLLVGGEGLAPKVPQLLEHLDRGDDLGTALQAAFGIGLAEFEQRLKLYVQRPIFRYETWKLGDLSLPEIGKPVEIPRAEALTLLAEYLAHAGVATAAREHLDAAVQEGGETGDALALLGFLAEKDGRTSEASGLYARALAASPKRACSALHAARFALDRAQQAAAGSAEEKEQLETASAAADRTLAIDPDFADAYVVRGLADLRGGDATSALVALAEAQQRAPGRSDVAYDRFLAAMAAGQTAVARGIATGSLARLDPKLAADAQRRFVEHERTELAGRAVAESDEALQAQRWDQAAAPLVAALDQVGEGPTRDYLQKRLDYVRGYVAQRQRIDRYNQAVALANDGRYPEAREAVTQALDGCDDEQLCAEARKLADWLDGRLRGRR
jgi:hypothetical protein